jgi:hypothetical protein
LTDSLASKEDYVAAPSGGLSVPDGELPYLRALAQAAVEHLEAVETAAGVERLSVEPEALCRSIAERTGLELATVTPVVLALVRLALVQRTFQLGTDVFLESVTRTLSQSRGDKWTSHDAESWVERLPNIKRLLSPEGAIAYTAKAGQLLSDQHLVFCKARILTDVRPVFDENANVVQGFIPFHILAMTWHEGAETRTVYVSMDSSDLALLRDQLDRAERKEKVLRTSLTQAGLPVICTGAESSE